MLERTTVGDNGPQLARADLFWMSLGVHHVSPHMGPFFNPSARSARKPPDLSAQSGRKPPDPRARGAAENPSYTRGGHFLGGAFFLARGAVENSVPAWILHN